MRWIAAPIEMRPRCWWGKRESDNVNRYQSSVGRSLVNLLESLEISEKATFNASSSGSNSSALAFICVVG